MALPLILAGLQIGAGLIGAKKEKKALAKQAASLEAEGKAAQLSAYFTAQQLTTAAGQQQAVGQRNAAEELRKSEVLQSRALAIAGASGGSASDPDMLRITSQIAAEGALAAKMQLYEGDESARAMKLNAAVSRWEGDKARQGINIQAKSVLDQRKSVNFNTLLSTASTAASWATSSSGKDFFSSLKKGT